MIPRLFALAPVLLAAVSYAADEQELGELKSLELADLQAAPFESTKDLLGQAVLLEYFAHW